MNEGIQVTHEWFAVLVNIQSYNSKQSNIEKASNLLSV